MAIYFKLAVLFFVIGPVYGPTFQITLLFMLVSSFETKQGSRLSVKNFIWYFGKKKLKNSQNNFF